MIHGVRHDYLLVKAETKAMRRVELGLRAPLRAEIGAHLHFRHFTVLSDRSIKITIASELLLLLLLLQT